MSQITMDMEQRHPSITRSAPNIGKDTWGIIGMDVIGSELVYRRPKVLL